MAEYQSRTPQISESKNPPKRRGYQETRRQDRDRREKRYQRANNGQPDDKKDDESPQDDLDSAQNIESQLEDHDIRSSESKPVTNPEDRKHSTTHQRSEYPRSANKDVSKQHDSYRDSRDLRDKYTKDRDVKDRTPRNRDDRGDTWDRTQREKIVKDRYKGDRYIGEREAKEKPRDKRAEREYYSSKYERDEPDSNRGSRQDYKEFKSSRRHDVSQNEPTNKPNPDKSEPTSLMDMLHITKESTPTKLKTRGSRDTKVVSAQDLEARWQKEEQERKAKEEKERNEREAEEEKKREEERIQREEEEKKVREEEEAERLIEEGKSQIESFIKESQERFCLKQQYRQQNLSAADNRPDESTYSKLDSNLKKCTAFVKKLRNTTESQEDSLLKDIKSLNLSKYIGEVASAFTEAKLKMSDIGCALRICSVLHQRYSEFSAALLENWHKVLLSKKDDKVVNASKLRVDLRFFADLITIGVFTEKEAMSLLSNQLIFLIKNDMREHNNLSILISFCRHCGDDYAGLVPTKFRLLAEKHGNTVPRSGFLKQERQLACRKLLKEYYTSLYKRLPVANKEVRAMERTSHTILMTKGELNDERKQRLETAQQSFLKLWQNATTYSDLVDEAMPELPPEEAKQDDVMGINIFSPDSQHIYDGESALFEDEDTRQFYENLPDLKAVVPQILYKDSEATETTKGEDEVAEETLESDINVEDLERELTEKEPEINELEVSKDGGDEVTSADGEDEDFDIAGSMKMILEEFLNSLPNSVNREMIDKAANDFCMNLNTKSNRKKLTRALFTVHRTRYDLLPFYSRLVATLHPCMPDVATELNALLKGDFRHHLRKKDQVYIESKLKIVRFIAELVKFRIFPKADVLHCLKMLLFDFSHHNIEMACALLDTCGRFLYRSTDSHHMTKVFLEVMVRKKNVLALDSRYTTMIENAFYYCNPPEYKKEEIKQRPPEHEYIRKLLYIDLNKITTEKILRQMRKIDWDNPEISAYAAKCLMSVWNVRFNVIHSCANLLAGLAPYHEKVAIRVIDGVLEDIRLGLEVNHPKFNQRRVSCVKYMGELYNYRMVESSVIFKTLYSFITFGVFLDDNIVSVFDPPEHLFRVRLVCSVLETCGQYFDRGSSKKKLDCFLVYFQRYYWFKRKHPRWTENLPFPIEVEYSCRDLLESLRPKLKVCQSFEEACADVEELEKEFRAKLAGLLAQTDMAVNADDSGLSTIQENDEVGDLSQDLSQLQLTGTDPSGDTTEGQSYSQESESQTQQSDSQSQSQRRERRADEEGEEGTGSQDEEHGDDDSVTSQHEDDDDTVSLRTGGPRHINCAEDDDFMTSFDKMLSDNVQARNNESVKVPQLDIAVPMHMRSQKAKYSLPGEEVVEDTGTPIKFMLVTRKGNKQHFSSLDVPVSDDLAAKYRQREEAEKLEKERVKRVVLDIHERQEEEDYQEMLESLNRCGSATANPNANRERRVRYQHPKGAPDADLIFGSKKR